jgi:membrane-bound serine protease (ClpP class)
MKNFTVIMVLTAILTCAAVGGAEAAGGKFVYLIRINSTINPGVAGYLERAIKDSESAQAEALVVELDTPGGLADSMREMVKDILDSKVPVVVYVAPSGARAASAGVMITIAAHVAVMAPGTNIGAASPVAIGTGGDKMDETMKSKVMNDMVAYAKSIAQKRGRNEKWAELAVREAVSITDVDAVINGVVDLRAANLTDLLEKIDGKEVDVAGNKVVLKTKGLEARELEEHFREKFLRTLANPNIAYLLMLIGLVGLYFELSNPGVILPGAVGALSLVLAFYALNMLPVNYAGVLLILLGVVLFIAEIKIASFGLLTVGGILCLLLGSIMLFKDQGSYLVRVSWGIILPTVIAVTLFFTVVIALVVKAQVKKPTTGAQGLVGERGVVRQKITPESGKVFVHGEYWNAVGDEVIEEGVSVEVVGLDQLKLVVKRVPPSAR